MNLTLKNNICNFDFHVLKTHYWNRQAVLSKMCPSDWKIPLLPAVSLLAFPKFKLFISTRTVQVKSPNFDFEPLSAAKVLVFRPLLGWKASFPIHWDDTDRSQTNLKGRVLREGTAVGCGRRDIASRTEMIDISRVDKGRGKRAWKHGSGNGKVWF